MKKIVILSIIVSFFNCDKKTVKYKEDELLVKLNFTDTVYINELNDGYIEIKNHFDTITTSLLDSKKLRFLYFEFFITKNPTKINDNILIKKMVTDTFVAETNRLIPLYSLEFKELGVNYIDGLITDEVIIEKGVILYDGSIGDKIITNEFRITKAVYVKEK